MTVTDRTFPKLTVDQYHKRPEISSGGIRCAASEGTWVFHEKHVLHNHDEEDSDAKRLGRAFHLSMADPNAWRESVVIMPELGPDGTELNLRKKTHRAMREQLSYSAAMSGKDLVYSYEMEPLRCMVESVWDNPAARKYVEQAHRDLVEVACVAKDKESGLGVRALADAWLRDAGAILDFKTTRFSTTADFVRDAIKKSYHFQSAWYLDVFGANDSVIISIRNKPPYESMVYHVPEYRIQFARNANRMALRRIKHCIDMDSFHSLGWGQVNPLEYEE